MDRQEALIYIGAAAVLAVAGLIIVAGLYVTRYRPPRALVLTVGSERFSASDAVTRGAYLVAVQGRSASVDRFALDTVDVLAEEAILRQRGPALVGEVSADDIEQELRARLGFATHADDGPDDAATATATAVADAPATGTGTAPAAAAGAADLSPTATTSPDDTAIDDRPAFARSYQAVLQQAGMGQQAYERIVRAELIERRLADQFAASIGDSGPQKRLARIRVTDFALAETIHQELLDGGDFAALHDEHSTGEGEAEGGDLGWTAVAALPAETAAAVRDLEAGRFSDVVTSGLNYDIFMVTEVSADQPYDPDTKQQLVDGQVQDWLDLEQARIEVRRDLSDSEERWVNEHTLAKARDLALAAAG